MIPLIAGALYGLAGYQNNQNRKREDERQSKIDERAEEEFARKKEAWATEDAIKTGMRDATAPVAVETPNDVLKDDDGNDMLAVPQFRAGTKRFETMAEAQAAAEKENTPEAVAARQTQVLNRNGKPLEAIQMQNALMDSKLKKLGLTKAEADSADEQFNRELLTKLDANPDWTKGVADILTSTQVGAFKGLTVTPRPSKDGKTVDFIGVGQDGVEQVLKTLPNSAQGKAEFLQNARKASIESKIGFVVEQAKSAQTQANSDRDFNLRKQESESNQQYRQRMVGIQAAQESRAAQVHKLAMDNAKIPAAVKLQASTLSEEMKSISSALNKAMAEGSFDPTTPNAKALIERQAVLGVKYRALLEPHMPNAGTKKADPLGLDAKPVATAVATPAAAASPPVAPAKTALPTPMQAATQTAPKVPTVLEALTGPGANPAVAQIMAPKAQAVESLAVQLKQAQAALAQAAKSGNTQTTVAQSQQVGALRQALQKELADMNPQQAALVMQAAGV